MKKVIVCIKANEGTYTFKFPNNSEETLEKLKELFVVFGNKHEGKSYLVMDKNIKKRANEYASKYFPTVPRLYEFKNFINSISVGNYLLLLNKELNIDEQMYFNFLIQSLNDSLNEKEVGRLIQEKYENLPESVKITIKNYDVEVFNQSKTKRIGEPDKNKRVPD